MSLKWLLFGFLILFRPLITLFAGPAESFPELVSIEHIKSYRPDSAYYLVNQIYRAAEEQGDENLVANCALELGEILYYLGNFDRANEYLIDAIGFFEDEQNKEKLAEAYTWQGIVVQYARQMPMALSLYRKALDLYLQEGDSIKIGELYGWIGHYYEKTENPDTALMYQYNAKNILEYQNAQQPLARIYDNIGSLYEDKGSYDSAHLYFRRSLLINSQSNEINDQIVNLNNIGDIHRKRGELEQSLTYTDSALKLAELYNIDYQKRSAHRDFAKTYFLLNDYEKAYQHQEIAYQIYSDILSEENSKRITLLQSVYESERKESRIQLLEKEKHISQILRGGLITAIIILLTVAILIIRGQKVKVKQSKKIIDQKTQIYQKEKALNELELKNALLKEEKLKSQIDNQKFIEHELQKNLELKSQLITSQTLQIIRRNNFLENLKNELNYIKKGDKVDRNNRINELMKSINHDITTDENWNDFNAIFSQVHKDFATNLKNMHTDISPAELRLCSLLKLNLNSGEIAAILGISTDSLRIARYRLRKKLGLSKNDNLVSHLINI